MQLSQLQQKSHQDMTETQAGSSIQMLLQNGATLPRSKQDDEDQLLQPVYRVELSSSRTTGRLAKYEIARSKAIEAWLDVNTARPGEDHADVIAGVNRLRKAERERPQDEPRQTFVGSRQVFKLLSMLYPRQMLQQMRCVKQLEKPSGGDIVEQEQVNSRSAITLQLSWLESWQI